MIPLFNRPKVRFHLKDRIEMKNYYNLICRIVSPKIKRTKMRFTLQLPHLLYRLTNLKMLWSRARKFRWLSRSRRLRKKKRFRGCKLQSSTSNRKDKVSKFWIRSKSSKLNLMKCLILRNQPVLIQKQKRSSSR